MRIGLVGYGKGGRFFHAPLIASLTGAKFVGVVTRSPERRQVLARDYPHVQAFDSLHELLAAGVDVVAISTPLAARHAQILEAIELGVAVVSDKPFALDEACARQLIEAAVQRGVLLSVYQNRRWDSDFLTVRKLIDSGALGQVSRFESSIERFSPASVGKQSGGGVLRDLGSHLVDQAQVLFGPVQQVYAELQYATAQVEVDHTFFMALTHAGGVVSHLSGSCLQDSPRPRFRVSGSKGCYTVEGLDVQEEQALAGQTPLSAGESWGVEEHRRWGWFEHGEHRERVPSQRGCWLQYYQQLQQAIDAGAANPVDPLQVLATTRVLDAARQSAAKRCVVAL